MGNSMDRSGMIRKRLTTRLWILILAAAFIALSAAALALRHAAPQHAVAVVYLDGERLRAIDLSEEAATWQFTVEQDGMTNRIEVRPGGIRIAEANCPDQTCVRQGWLEGGMTPIVCLPHRLVIRPESDTGEAPLDAVAG